MKICSLHLSIEAFKKFERAFKNVVLSERKRLIIDE